MEHPAVAAAAVAVKLRYESVNKPTGPQAAAVAMAAVAADMWTETRLRAKTEGGVITKAAVKAELAPKHTNKRGV